MRLSELRDWRSLLGGEREKERRRRRDGKGEGREEGGRCRERSEEGCQPFP